MDAIRQLVSTAVVLENLPEKPDTNGSVLLIDDEEAARCAAEINAAIQAGEALRKDAERYRWLREQIVRGLLVIAKPSGWDGLVSWSGDEPDSRIDAEMGAPAVGAA